MKKLRTLIIIIALCFLGFFIWWSLGKMPVNPQDKTQKTFVISSQENVRDIGYKLKQENLINNPVVFFLTVKELGLDGKIQAGNFHLSPSMNTEQIAEALTHGNTDIWVTIPEGKRATEIAEILASKLPQYNASWSNKLATQEGYLFPDTYSFPTNADVSLVMKTMEQNFMQKYALAKAQQTVSMPQSQAVILASIVEREAISQQDMRGVASVLENRLNLGMALGSDVTVEYALGYQPVAKTWWKKDLTVDDLAIDSPYNTRKFSGLPPTPISNPGLTALEAVLNPLQTDYLYYVSDATGKLHFAKTVDEHNANVAKYMQ